MCNFEVLMRNLSGPEDVLGAFQLMLLAVANTKTQDLKPNDVLGKYEAFQNILNEDHRRVIMSEGEVFHEKQRLELCAIHALNNVLQEQVFTKETADDICKRLAPQCVVNPHRSMLGTGNYDVNVIMAALQSRELAAVWWDKRRTVQSLCVDKVQGFILNVPSRVSLGIVSLPVKRRHWLAVRQVNGHYYNLDSKLKSPVCIGNEADLRTFLSEVLSPDVAEMLLVVRRDVEEYGTWLNSDDLRK